MCNKYILRLGKFKINVDSRSVFCYLTNIVKFLYFVLKTIGQMAGSCKRGKESSGFIRFGVFNDKLSDRFRGIEPKYCLSLHFNIIFLYE